MKKILITGGGGFIGTHVCDLLKKKGYQPIRFDHRVPTDFLGDVTDYTAVSEAVAVSDGVIHLAGVLGTQETIQEPLPAVQTNILGSLNVFKACKHYKKKCVYIAVGNHWMNNTYSITKTTAERFALMFNKEFDTQIAVVRGLNAYGPGQKEKPVRKIMPNFVLPALRGEAITVYGDGTNIMDMIYVDDLADILVRALLLNHKIYDRVFEAGTGRPTTVKQIAEEVIRQVGRGSIKYVPMRPGEPEKAVVLADSNTLLPLGPINFMPLKEGIAKTIDYYKNI